MVGDGGVLPNQVPCVPQGALCVALRPCRFTNPATFSCFTQALNMVSLWITTVQPFSLPSQLLSWHYPNMV